MAAAVPRRKATASEGREERLNEAMELLRSGVGAILGGEEFRRYLDLAARFHRYSAKNCLLILMQRPEATRVAGYRAWQGMGRQVRKGEKGIRILAPVARKVEDEATGEEVRVLRGFRVASVFDVSQTEGEPLPEAPAPRDLDPEYRSGVAGRVCEGLTRLCGAEGVAVETEEMRPGAYGAYHRGEKRITLNSRLSPVDRATTLAHELAHHLLHAEGDGAGRGARETEAEGASYALFSYFGLDTGKFTFAYVARYAEDPEALGAALGRIQKAARRLIEAVEGNG